MRYQLNVQPEAFSFEAGLGARGGELDQREAGFGAFEAPLAWEQETSGASYVRWIQESLNRILGLTLAVDGNAGPQTRSAIRTFQQQQGLTVDGVVGPATDAAIRAALTRPTAEPGYREDPCSGLRSPEVLDLFEFDRDQVRPQHLPLIQRIAACIAASARTRPGPLQVRLVGHTDPTGSDAYNLQLAQRRAEQVRQQLQQALERLQPGLGRSATFVTETRGEREPVSSDAAKNRRVEVFIQAQPKPGPRAPRPLRPDEIPNVIKPRWPLKSAASIAIELPLIVPASAMSSLKLLTARADVARSAGAAGDAMIVTALQLQGTLGKQITPPGIGVSATPPLPREQLKAVQRELRSLSGMLPDHLPLLPQPARVPAELEARPRIHVQLPKERPRDLHEPTTIFKPDDRNVFRDTSFPWSTIGRVETPAGICSGTMVGPRHLLTCSHGVQWLPSGAGWVKFTPAYFDGGVPPFGFAYGIKTYFLKKVDGSDGIDREEGQYDYVVVVLGTRLGDLTGWMGLRSWSDDWDNEPLWAHAGYPGDVTSTQRPTFQSGIALDGSFWDREIHTRIFHKGDVFPGQSGGPFFGWWSGESFPSVVAVQSGQTSDENSASGGADMIELVSKARRDFP
jgi:outer membrane protein OmpA-like peptidoglycan-associated protein/V8-like Glu-specific endopeptidase